MVFQGANSVVLGGILFLFGRLLAILYILNGKGQLIIENVLVAKPQVFTRYCLVCDITGDNT